MKSALQECFRLKFGRVPEIIARAPGRIEFIGNHTDYNGGTVLGAAIDRGVWVGLARRTDGQWNFASVQKEGVVRVTAEDFTRRAGAEAWVNYPLGVIEALRVFGLGAPAGFDYLASSDLPLGAGLSSSAAIELSSALAFSRAVGPEPARELLVKVSRHAENHFVGVPCGILDQGVSGFGRSNHLVFIDCRGPRFETVPLPAAVHFWIFNTHTKHALVDGLYAARHRECMEAARALGVGLLVEAPAGALEAARGRLPPVAEKRARHILDEIARVTATVAALRAGDLAAVGQLLTASHRSSQTFFENSTPELDFLVEALIATPQVHGARLTGGGFGGAVMAMTTGAFTAADADRVAAAYAGRFGARPDVLHTLTADGAQLI
jgi:galactokinase